MRVSPSNTHQGNDFPGPSFAKAYTRFYGIGVEGDYLPRRGIGDSVPKVLKVKCFLFTNGRKMLVLIVHQETEDGRSALFLGNIYNSRQIFLCK